MRNRFFKSFDILKEKRFKNNQIDTKCMVTARHENNRDFLNISGSNRKCVGGSKGSFAELNRFDYVGSTKNSFIYRLLVKSRLFPVQTGSERMPYFIND